MWVGIGPTHEKEREKVMHERGEKRVGFIISYGCHVSTRQGSLDKIKSRCK